MLVGTIDEGLPVESACDLASFSGDDGRIRGHGNLRADRAQLKDDIDSSRLPAGDQNIFGDESLEATAGSRQSISAGREIRDFIIAIGRSDGFARDVRLHVRQRNFGRRNSASAWIASRCRGSWKDRFGPIGPRPK